LLELEYQSAKGIKLTTAVGLPPQQDNRPSPRPQGIAYKDKEWLYSWMFIAFIIK
jgi:hypothetical protein